MTRDELVEAMARARVASSCGEDIWDDMLITVRAAHLADMAAALSAAEAHGWGMVPTSHITGGDFHEAPDGPDWQVRVFFETGDQAREFRDAIATAIEKEPG